MFVPVQQGHQVVNATVVATATTNTTTIISAATAATAAATAIDRARGPEQHRLRHGVQHTTNVVRWHSEELHAREHACIGIGIALHHH